MARRDIAPYETFVCENLTRDIALCDDRTSSAVTTQQPPASLAAVLEHASINIQYHAKWFTPAALSVLLETAINVASRSTSTTDLHATLKLVDTVLTYSVLPALQPAVRFIAYSYYQGSRSNRHQKLSQHAWELAEHVLESHLGGQFTSVLLEIIGSLEHLRSKFIFGAAIGALMMTTDKVIIQHEQLMPGIHFTQLLLGLDKAATDEDDVLREQVVIMLGALLLDESCARGVEDSGALDLWLDIVERCIKSHIEKDALDRVFDNLEARIPMFEARHHPVLAQLFVEVGRVLPDALAGQLLIPWHRALVLHEDTLRTVKYRDILGRLCESNLYLDVLGTFIDISVSAFFQSDNFIARRDFVYTLETLIKGPNTDANAIDALANGIAKIFSYKTQKEKWEGQRNWLFPLLCEIARESLVATTLLLRIRADQVGQGFLEVDPLSDWAITIHGHQSRSSSLYGLTSLSLTSWVSTIRSMILHEPRRWDVYNVLLTSLASQIRNHALWRDHYADINSIRQTLCDALAADQFIEPPPATGLTKSFVVGQLLQILTATVSFHAHLPRNDIKAAVVTLINVAGSRDHTVSIQCIHGLTICCYELPELMAGYMELIIAKMTRMVTQRFLALYVLEFFAGLSRFPDLQDRLRGDDFKRIFGVCHSYLQFIRSTTALERNRTPTSEQSSGMNSSTSSDDMAHYVYALAHHVITFWYIALKPEDRHGLKEYVTGCLRYESADGEQHIEDQGLVTIDLMDRIDSEGRVDLGSDTSFDRGDGRILTLHRVTGILLITTETALRTGKTVVTVRRPSGTTKHVISSHMRHDSGNPQGLDGRTVSVTLESDMQDYLSVFPGDIVGRTYGKVVIPRPSSALGSLDIITLPEEDAVTRAVQSVDRMSALDCHKAGIVFIGEDQTTEREILLNKSGSPDYREFLEDMGSLRRLRDAKFNTQGLDRLADADGEYTIVWNKDVTELVYHITTFMPNDTDDGDDMTIVRKKSHIGNDFVNIIFNNSGSDFRFNTFPSAFNYVYIVISPSDRTSFLQARELTAHQDKTQRFYNVQVLTRPGFPSLSSASDVKVISGASLGGYVRNIALNACVFSAMWQAADESGEYPSSWRARLHMIRRLYKQYSPSAAA